VTEAILLDAPELELVAHCDDERLRVEVRNGLVAQFFDTPSAGYRRRVLDALAEVWAADPTDRGTVVWFEVRAG
jgi:hypothetical protein